MKGTIWSKMFLFFYGMHLFFKSEFSDKCFGYDFCNNYTLKKVDLSFEIRDVIAWKYIVSFNNPLAAG